MRNLIRMSIVLLTFAGVLAACELDPPINTTSQPPTLPTVTTASDDALDCVERTGDLEGCFEYQDMYAFFTISKDLVLEYIRDVYANPPMEPKDWLYVKEGVVEAQASCVNKDSNGQAITAYYTDTSYEYCSLDQFVSIGQRSLWVFYSQLGDGAAVIGMAHEAGHHFQAMAGVVATTQTEGIAKENQADCIAGSFTQWADLKGYLDYPDDVNDVDALMLAIGELESDPDRTHGTPEERADSFVHGVNYGLLGCSQFFPNTPLIIVAP